MKKLRRKVRDLRDLRVHARGKYKYTVSTADKDLAERVRKLQAEVYLAHGNIHKDQINEYGFLDSKTDPYFANSVYFAAERDVQLLAGGRLILAKNGYQSLQIAKEIEYLSLPTDVKEALDRHACCEMSGMVKKKYASKVLPLLIVREMLLYAQAHDITHILMSIAHQPYEKYKQLFGDALKDIGEPYRIPHGNNMVYPCSVHIEQSQSHLRETLPSSGYVEKMIKKIVVA